MMKSPREILRCRGQVLLAVLATGIISAAANGAVTLLGVQYQQDNPYTEFQCIWHDRNYPTSCGSVVGGSNVHVYLKNTGGSSVTVSDVTLAGYSLATVIADGGYGNSIYFNWDNPPQDILDAGEPVWFKADPNPIPAGGTAQAVIRLRYVPTTPTVSVGVLTSSGTVNATIPISATAPQLASVGFSRDLTKVYLHWRRDGAPGAGAAPATIWMDGTNVTASTTTVGDPTVNFAASVISLSNPLTAISYHVFQGVYADGKTATASIRAWANRFLYSTYGVFTNLTTHDWIVEAANHGVNNCQLGGLGSYLGTGPGQQDMVTYEFGYTTLDLGHMTPGVPPDMWFLNDEPDAQEDNQASLHCGTGLKIPCGSGHSTGILCTQVIAYGETLRAASPLTPTTVNMDGTLKPDNYYAWGQAVDILQVDPYYQRRLSDTYWYYPERIPLYRKATYNYAVARAVTSAAEPNPSNVILYCCEWKDTSTGNIWPFPTPESKRIEVYYSLAGGARGMCYWWFNSAYPSKGLDARTPTALALWKEMGLLGNEIKTISPLLVTSTPVSMTLTPSTNVWVRSLASGTDTIILLAVNDNYYNDQAGCHYTPVANATVTASLPSWMTASPTAFEISPSGLSNVTTQLNGSQLQLTLGTLNLTKMIVITTNPQLRATIQQRYEEKVWPGICAFAPEYCTPQNNPPTITQHPSNQTVAPGDTATFTVVAAGSSPLSYQWQKNSVNVTNGGHYSGCTTATLTVSSADSSDAASYRCVVTNPYGTATSNAATLTLGTATAPTITQQPANQSVIPGGTATFGVTATGTSPLSYQWQQNQANFTNGGHYSGATTATLTISSADSNDAANYRCVVTNPYGSATSNEAALTVTACSTPILLNGGFEGGNTGGIATSWTGYTRAEVPTTLVYTIQIASPPEGLQYQQIQTSYVASGGAGVYQVVTGCTSGATYTIAGSFRTNSANGRATVKCAPNGSTSYSSAIDLTPAATTTSSTWVTLSGTVTATSSSITLFLDSQTYVSGSTAKAAAFDGLTVTGCTAPPVGPTITQQPGAQNACSGGTATFIVAATGDAPLSYQWQKNSANVTNGGHYSGATTTTLTVSSADAGDVTSYRCVVTNASGSATSNAASLALKVATAISQHPQAQSIAAGGTATFSVAATGDGTLSYQWQKNGSNVTDGGHYAGCTTATLAISSTDSSDVANYRCVVTGGCGSVTSNQATLTVGAPPIPGDFDHDGDVDQEDFGHLQDCLGPASAPPDDPNCADADLDKDPIGAVSQGDVLVFLRCMTGAGVAGNPNCAE